MICTNCGARLMETDHFCPKCGAKAIKDRRCQDCGALLRDGAKFCPKCGRSVSGNGGESKISDDTLDIPIDAIERNILSETAAEIKADRRASGTSRRPASSSGASKSSSTHSSSERNTASKSVPSKRKTAEPEPPRKKKVVYREEDWEEDDWDDDDWDDDDWDDDEEGGVDIITAMTAVVGCVLLVVVAVLGYHLFRQYVPKDYDKVAEEEQEQQDEQEEEGQQQGAANGVDSEIGEDRETYTLTVIHNVNVRDNPSTYGTNVLKVAQEGETYTSYGAVDGDQWYEILLEDGTIGYVFYEYITIE